MAKKSTIPKGGFEEGSQIEKWLVSLSKDKLVVFARIVSERCAARCLPIVFGFLEEDGKDDKWQHSLIITSMRIVVVLRISALFYMNVSHTTLREAALSALAVKSSGFSANFKLLTLASDAARSAARSALSTVDNSDVITPFAVEAIILSADACAFAAVSSSSGSDGSYVWFSRNRAWQAVTADARALEAGATPEEMAARPLWPEDSPYKPQFDRKTFLAAAPSFEVWLDWYEPIVDGKAPWGLPRDIANKLEERIALGDNGEDGGKAFWERDADEVNAEIKGWVEAARAEILLAKPTFAPGLQFGWLDRMVRLVRGDGLSNPIDDQKRISEQIPILAKLVGRLKAKLEQIETPCDGLLEATTDLQLLLSRTNKSEIGVSELQALTLIFRAELYEQQNPPFGRNTLPLSGSELATAESIATISDLIVLATDEGRKIFDDADRASQDAGGMDQYHELELGLLDILSADGTIIEPDSAKLIKTFLLAKGRGPYQIRTGALASGSMLNITMVVAGVGVVGAIGYGIVAVPVVSIAAAYLGKLVLGEGIKKSKLGLTFNENITKQIDRATVEKIWANRELIRKTADNRPSAKWLLDILDWAERNKK